MRKEIIALLFVISALIVAYFVLPGMRGGMKKDKDKEKIIAPSIAVLPFVNMSNDPNQEYFSDELGSHRRRISPRHFIESRL